MTRDATTGRFLPAGNSAADTTTEIIPDEGPGAPPESPPAEEKPPGVEVVPADVIPADITPRRPLWQRLGIAAVVVAVPGGVVAYGAWWLHKQWRQAQ